MLLRSFLPQLCFATLLSFVALEARAQSIIIQDCQGFTRVAQKVEKDVASKLEIQVEGGTTTGPQEITLTNQVTGAQVTTTAVNGTATFANLGPGLWTVQAIDASLKLVALKLSPMAFGALASTAAVTAAVGTAGGAATGVGVAIVDAVESESSEPTPTPTPTPLPTPPPTPLPTPVATPDACPECDPDLEPTPLDPFFDVTPIPLSRAR